MLLIVMISVSSDMLCVCLKYILLYVIKMPLVYTNNILTVK